MAEALVRVRGELISDGFQVELLDGAQDSPSRAWLEDLAKSRNADAVVAVLGNEDPDSVEVWVVDQVTRKSVVREIPFQPQADQAAKTFAIHTLELLRASFLEINLAPATRPSVQAAVPAVVSNFVGLEQQANRSGRLGIEIGGTVAMSFDGVDPTILPVLHLSWPLWRSLLADVAVAGLGTSPKVQSGHVRAAGQADSIASAQMTEQFLLLGVRNRFGPTWRVRPVISLAAGVLHTAVDGHADRPFQGQSADQWSFLADAGVGLEVPFAGHFSLTLAGHEQLADPYPAIRYGGAVIATTTRPATLIALSLGVWL